MTSTSHLPLSLVSASTGRAYKKSPVTFNFKMKNREYVDSLVKTIFMLHGSLEEARSIVCFYQEKYKDLKKELMFFRKIENGKKRNRKSLTNDIPIR